MATITMPSGERRFALMPLSMVVGSPSPGVTGEDIEGVSLEVSPGLSGKGSGMLLQLVSLQHLKFKWSMLKPHWTEPLDKEDRSFSLCMAALESAIHKKIYRIIRSQTKIICLVSYRRLDAVRRAWGKKIIKFRIG